MVCGRGLGDGDGADGGGGNSKANKTETSVFLSGLCASHATLFCQITSCSLSLNNAV